MIEPSERIGVAVGFNTSRKVLLDCVGSCKGSVATRTVVLIVLRELFPFRLERRIIDTWREDSADFCVSFSSSLWDYIG